MEQKDTTEEKTKNQPKLGLKPLTPQYVEKQHRVYVDALKEALSQEGVHNIALSGPYGVGKSSVLEGLAQDQSLNKKIVSVSLSTLGCAIQTTSNEGISDTIQKEIVKQLLYSVSPSKLPDSRFQRIGNTRRLLLGFLALVTSFILMEWAKDHFLPEYLLTFISQSDWFRSVIYVVTVVLTTCGVYYLLQWARSALHPKEVSTGIAKISLDRDSATIFDHYLDELVYYFHRTGKNIVIFEDIDRFDRLDIFEQLRALNTLLNACPKRWKIPIPIWCMNLYTRIYTRTLGKIPPA